MVTLSIGLPEARAGFDRQTMDPGLQISPNFVQVSIGCRGGVQPRLDCRVETRTQMSGDCAGRCSEMFGTSSLPVTRGNDVALDVRGTRFRGPQASNTCH